MNKGAEMFHADGRTDMTKLTVAIRKFQKAPKNGSLLAADISHLNFSTVHLSLYLSLALKNLLITCFPSPPSHG
jgi:hypothetical protein